MLIRVHCRLLSPSFNYVSAAGFSGVIFSLLTLESYVIDLDTLPYD